MKGASNNTPVKTIRFEFLFLFLRTRCITFQHIHNILLFFINSPAVGGHVDVLTLKIRG